MSVEVNKQCGYCFNRGTMCPLYGIEIVKVNRDRRRNCRKVINKRAAK